MRRYTHLLAVIAILALALAALPATPARAGPGLPDRAVAGPFRDYYQRHQGMRVLGYPLTDLTEVNGYAAQYFEKGRIEDHRSEAVTPDWSFMYGRLTAELLERAPMLPVNSTDITYNQLQESAGPQYRHAPPPDFAAGVRWTARGIFVPYEAHLQAAPGYFVPQVFWSYITRRDLFPGGWLHDIGLPMTDAMTVETIKGGEPRTITMQAFERSILTFDALNPAEWRVERGNIGTDMVQSQQTSLAGAITEPAAGARVTLPIHFIGQAGRPGDTFMIVVRWADGTTTSRSVIAQQFSPQAPKHGLLIGSVGWLNAAEPPATQPATIELRDMNGVVLARQPVMVLGLNDADSQAIQLYWVLGDQVHPFQARVVRTPRIGTAALNELLWGPPPNQAGYTSAIPTPEQVLTYPGRGSDWNIRVTLRSLVIENGVATADFSKEMNAYGGGSLRVQQIREQITRTLLQFPTVHEVRIAIEGQTKGVLEP